MTSQIEKLHTLNLFAKSLRDSRITMKTYLFDFKKVKIKILKQTSLLFLSE